MAAIRDIKLGVIIRPERQIKAEVLREAAEAWGDGAEGFPYNWLLDRAAEIEEGKTPDWSAG